MAFLEEASGSALSKIFQALFDQLLLHCTIRRHYWLRQSNLTKFNSNKIRSLSGFCELDHIWTSDFAHDSGKIKAKPQTTHRRLTSAIEGIIPRPCHAAG